MGDTGVGEGRTYGPGPASGEVEPGLEGVLRSGWGWGARVGISSCGRGGLVERDDEEAERGMSIASGERPGG